jgi:hypothetical protein
MKSVLRRDGSANLWAGRHGGLRRQWSIYGLLRRRSLGITVPEISRELDIPRRTAYRDLATMSEVLPIYSDRENRSDGRGCVEVWKVMRDA